jgi:hypothetical protein
MFKAMALKEFREIRGLVLLALVAYILLLAGVIGSDSPWNIFWLFGWFRTYNLGIPFLSDDFRDWFLVISIIFAIALALRQSFGEALGGTYPFLFHRPANRCRLIATKLSVGVGVYLIVTITVIFIYAAWAATPATHASPFEWGMAAPTLVATLANTIFYLGVYLSVIRPGRWHGSRLLPLVTAVFLALAAIMLVGRSEIFVWPLVITLLGDVWLVAMILFVVRTRDYT